MTASEAPIESFVSNGGRLPRSGDGFNFDQAVTGLRPPASRTADGSADLFNLTGVNDLSGLASAYRREQLRRLQVSRRRRSGRTPPTPTSPACSASTDRGGRSAARTVRRPRRRTLAGGGADRLGRRPSRGRPAFPDRSEQAARLRSRRRRAGCGVRPTLRRMAATRRPPESRPRSASIGTDRERDDVGHHGEPVAPGQTADPTSSSTRRRSSTRSSDDDGRGRSRSESGARWRTRSSSRSKRASCGRVPVADTLNANEQVTIWSTSRRRTRRRE